MKFQRLFKISSYGLFLSGFLALACTGAVELTGVLLYALVLGSSWWWEDRRSLLPVRVQNVLILAYLGFYLADLSYFSRPVLATVHLVFFVSAIKLFSRKSPRDYLLLYLFSFAQLLIAATFTINMLFVLHLFLFVLFGIGCLTLHEVFSSKWSLGEDPPPGDGPFWGAGPFLANTFGVTVAICLLAVPFFLILPRFPSSFVRNSAREAALSGFTDHVNLGDIGRIKLNSALVMRVKVNRPVSEIPPDLKWRGISLAHFDGSGWTRGVDWTPVAANASGGYRVGTESYRSTDALKQIFVMEPASPGVLFHAPHLISVSNEVQDLVTDAGGNFFYRRPLFGGGKYTLFSAVVRGEQWMARPLRGLVLPAVTGRYLALPEIDPRIGELAQQVTAGDKDVLEKAKSIEQFLKSNFRYSLDLAVPRGTDPLGYFLFEAKAGHCEFFASAAAVMLRTLGIPARIVNGFRRGEFNDWGNNFIVRQSDAHSWVEAYVAGVGWLEFDPTPADSDRPAPAWLATLGHFFDAVDLYWTTEILTYDFWKQVSFFRSVRERLAAVSRQVDGWVAESWRASELSWSSLKSSLESSLKSSLRSSLKSGPPDTQRGWILWGSLLATAAWLLFRFRLTLLAAAARLAPRSRSPHVKALLVSRCYLRFLRKLEKRGFRRRQGETARELVARIDAATLHAAAAAFTDLYYELRYGSTAAPDLDRPTPRVQALIAALQRV